MWKACNGCGGDDSVRVAAQEEIELVGRFGDFRQRLAAVDACNRALQSLAVLPARQAHHLPVVASKKKKKECEKKRRKNEKKKRKRKRKRKKNGARTRKGY